MKLGSFPDFTPLELGAKDLVHEFLLRSQGLAVVPRHLPEINALILCLTS